MELEDKTLIFVKNYLEDGVFRITREDIKILYDLCINQRKEINRIKSLDYTKLVDDFEAGLFIHKSKIDKAINDLSKIEHYGLSNESKIAAHYAAECLRGILRGERVGNWNQ